MSIQRPQRLSSRVLFILLMGLLLYISTSISNDATMEERTRLLAYSTFFACAVFATSLPNALIPDPLLGTYQLLNTPPADLLREQLKRWAPWISALCFPVLLIAWTDVSNPLEALYTKLVLCLAHLLVVIGTGLYSLSIYYSIGPSSQRWQEGTDGTWWKKATEVHPTLQPAVPTGLLPALTATVRVFGLGVLVVVLSMYLARDVGPIHALWPGLLLFGWSVHRLFRSHRSFDRYYYHTNAFYSEVLRSGSFSAEVKETTPYEALYWVPSRWRPHTWAQLVQLERAIPLSRFVILGILFLWIIAWTDASQALIFAILMLLITGKNLSVFIFTRNDLSARSLSQSLQSVNDWGITRGFVNLKWTLALAVGLTPIVWLKQDVSLQIASMWVLADIICSFLFAWCITYGTAYRERNAYPG